MKALKGLRGLFEIQNGMLICNQDGYTYKNLLKTGK